MTVNSREVLPTVRGRQTQAAIDAAARTVVARKGFLATTVFRNARRDGYRLADDPKITAPANVFHRTIYRKETGPT